ncbi:hybrid sensor histidine kinase/response regulator [Massilia sp. W12]|uniref:hybrid sensor histidine kinase/response regulator n=1 Tax=Massilia sp. W12 TaxID=3126507 RepID=UPI0030CABC49
MSEGTILCVDDDPTVLSALRALLGRLGPSWVIEIAESGEEALEIEAELREAGSDLTVVVSDFIMPGMRGDELLVKLHQLSPSTVKIMLTGQSAFDGVKRAINEANLYRFLEKPFNNDDLLMTVKSACHAFGQERALKRQNDELRTLNTELEQMVQRLTRQQEMLARSEAKATIGMLVASVTHELASPLGNSAIAADMLAEQVVQVSDALENNQLRRSDLDEFVRNVCSGAELLQKNLGRAKELLMNFKQVAADQASEQRRCFDLAEVLHEVLASVAPSLRGRTQRVQADIPPGINMDSRPGALGQVLINMINNAMLHAFEGKPDGVLEIKAHCKEDEPGMVELSVTDNGCGMDADTLSHLLQPFFSTKIGRGGTGLGMSIVDNLVRKALGGRWEVSSTPGQGSRFVITVPCILPLNQAAA